MENWRKQLSEIGYALLALFIGEEVLFDLLTNNSDLERDHSSTLYRRTWRLWDDAFRKLLKIRPLVDDDSLLICIKQRRYLGRNFSINGVTIHRFDPILELHMNNHCISQALNEEQTIVQLARRLVLEANRSFHVLADYIASKEFERAKALYGITLIHRGVRRFGFEILPISNIFTRHFLTWYLRNIFFAFNPSAHSLISARPQTFVPKRIAVTKEQFLQNFGLHLSNHENELLLDKVQ